MNPSLENPFRPTDKRATKRLFKSELPAKQKNTKEQIDNKLEQTKIIYGPHKIFIPQVQFMKQVEKLIPKEVMEEEGKTVRQILEKKIKVKSGNIIYLDLGSVGLTSLPQEIGQLTNLKYFSCWSNNLEKLPAEIGQLTNLKKFYCNANRLSEIPVELGKLANLQEFNCSSNELSKLPDEISQLTNLQKFGCWLNLLSEDEKRRIKKIFPFANV